jgi:hypothetical protein
MMPSARPLAALALFSLLIPATAFAQSDSDKATARELGRTAEGLLDAQDFPKAEDAFRRADALFHAPTLILGLARAQAKQGKVVEAWESYNQIIRENNTSSTAFGNALADAQVEIAVVEKRRARVTITVSGGDSPSVTIDAAPIKVEALGIARFMNPGAHVFKATAAGGKTASQSLTIPEGADQTVALVLAVAPAAVPESAPSTEPSPSTPEAPASGGGSWQRTTGFVAMGVGGAFLVEGIITGILVIGKHSSLATGCPGGVCPSNEDSALSSYNTMGTLSTIGFIAGPVIAAGGLLLFLTAPKNDATTAPASGFQVKPYVGFGSLGATGRF